MNDIEEYLDEIDALLTKTGKLIEKCVHVAPTPAKSFERFAQRLQTFYEQKSELPPSARKDFGDYDRASPFVKFIHAIWMALPNFNGKSRSLSQMTRRLAGVLMAPE